MYYDGNSGYYLRYNFEANEYEKVNNPLSYHLKQHFRMRRRKRSQRSQSINEPTSHQQQVADKVKVKKKSK